MGFVIASIGFVEVAEILPGERQKHAEISCHYQA